MTGVTVAGLTLMVPEGFVDRTNYTFRDAEGARLSVSFDLGGGGEPLADLASQTREDALRGLEAQEIGGPTAATVAGMPAIIQAFDYVDAGRTYRERVAVARSDQRQLILSYAGPPGAVDAAAGGIFRSAAWGNMPAEAPPAGFVARQAGALALNLPASLAPPRQVAIGSADGAIQATLGEVGGTAGSRAPSEMLARDRELGRDVLELHTRTIRSQRATVLSYVTVEDDDSDTGRRQAVRRVLIQGVGGRDLALHIVAPPGRAEQADGLLATLLAQLERQR